MVTDDIKFSYKKIHIPKNKRIIAVSDIHGHKTLLEKLLAKINFSEQDILILLGDYVERGVQNLPAIKYVMELCKRENVFAVMGNVDIWRLNGICNESLCDNKSLLDATELFFAAHGSTLFSEMALKLGYKKLNIDNISEARSRVKEHFREIFDFIQNLPTVIESEDYYFVHGGLPTEDFYSVKRAKPFMKVDEFLKTHMNFSKYTLVGHWPVINYGQIYPQHNPIINHEKKIIAVDGGCGVKSDGQLNAFIITNGEFSFCSLDELPEVTALENQAASDTSLFIPWVDNEIEIISRNSHAATVRHISTGRIFDIPYSYIIEENNKYCCTDYSNYLLEVKKGDKLSLIKKNNSSILAKKDGIIGWYYGKHRE